MLFRSVREIMGAERVAALLALLEVELSARFASEVAGGPQVSAAAGIDRFELCARGQHRRAHTPSARDSSGRPGAQKYRSKRLSSASHSSLGA